MPVVLVLFAAGKRGRPLLSDGSTALAPLLRATVRRFPFLYTTEEELEQTKMQRKITCIKNEYEPYYPNHNI